MFFHSGQTKQQFLKNMLFWGRKSRWGVVWISLACGPIYRRISWLHPVWVAPFPRFGSCTAGVSMQAIVPHGCDQLLQAPAPWLPRNDGQQLGSEPSSSKLRRQCVWSQRQQRNCSIRKTVFCWEGHTLVTSAHTQGIPNTSVLFPQGHSTLSNCDNGLFPFISLFLSHLPSFCLFLFPPTPQFYGRFIWFGKKKLPVVIGIF